MLFHSLANDMSSKKPIGSPTIEPSICGNYSQVQEVWQQYHPSPTRKTNIWKEYINALPKWGKLLIQDNIEIDIEYLLHLIRKRGRGQLYFAPMMVQNQTLVLMIWKYLMEKE